MDARRVRIRDVAAHAGVSTATVSRALNNAPTVDPELAERVRRSADALGYRPNRVARNLRRRAGSVWALLISDIENPFFTSVARGVEEAALEHGYSVVLCNTNEDPERERRYLDVVLAEQAAGVIIAPATERTDLGVLQAHRVPVVTIDRRIGGVALDAVVVDNRSGAQHATNHLLDNGYERVACISGPADVSTAEERRLGYLAALEDRGHGAVGERYVRRTDYRVAGGYAAACELLDQSPAPDAFFVGNSLMAAGAMRALVERGAKIPDQFGMVCFDDSPWAPLMAPALTTVEQPTYQLGQTAASLLLDRLGGESAVPQLVTLATTLRIRESSKGPRPPGGA
ncbi:LacI family DNA-binding transcriptional regulator [Flindersiella endophytica]